MKSIKSKAKKIIVSVGAALVIGITGTQTTLLDTSKINYPLTANTNLEKMEYLYQTQEALSVQHKEMAAKFHEGKMTQEEWNAYDDYFTKHTNYLVGSAIATVGGKMDDVVVGSVYSATSSKMVDKKANARQFYKEVMKRSDRWQVNLDNIIKK